MVCKHLCVMGGGVKVVMELHWSSTEKVCKFGHRGIDTRTTTPSRAMALNSFPLVWERSFSPRFCKKKNKDGIILPNWGNGIWTHDIAVKVLCLTAWRMPIIHINIQLLHLEIFGRNTIEKSWLKFVKYVIINLYGNLLYVLYTSIWYVWTIYYFM